MPGFRDITSGNNGAYTAGPGWDACSGLGSPDGTALLNRFQGLSVSPAPHDLHHDVPAGGSL